MFKRANKITALLVAAASVMAVVPAMAADTTRLGTKDGTITNAIAFGDGKYLFEGYKSDDNDSGLYYNDGSKDKMLDDATEFVTTSSAVLQTGSFSDTTVKYSDKEVMAADGSDRYVIDLSTGKVSDEDSQSDLMDNVKTKLNSKLDKTDRYTALSNLKLMKVDNGNFGDTWYQYTATTAAGTLYGFTTDGAKYIDASNLANISIYVQGYNGKVTDKVVKVEEFDKTKDGVTVSLTNVQYLAQDKDNIYVLSEVSVTGTGTANLSGADAQRYFIQKISKTQGDKKDDAYLPKTVTSYEIDDKSIYDDGDSADAYKVIVPTSTTFDTVAGNTVADGTVQHVSVIDGSLYVTTVKADGKNVKVTKVDLKKVKDDFVSTGSTAYGTATKVDAYVAKKDDSSDQDIATGAKGWAVDVNGYTWAIKDGKIYKFDKLDKKTVFTCDRSIDTIDVYDDNNLIAWDASGDVYTTVTEGKAETSSEATVVAPTAPVTGWVKNTDGTWSWNDYTGVKVATKWINDKGAWYFLKADGNMATGWYNDNGTWYYLNPSSGAMATGWLNDNGTWYYLAGSGAMLANTTVDGYVLGANGAWVK